MCELEPIFSKLKPFVPFRLPLFCFARLQKFAPKKTIGTSLGRSELPVLVLGSKSKLALGLVSKPKLELILFLKNGSIVVFVGHTRNKIHVFQKK